MEGDFYVEYGRLDDYQREIIKTMFYNNEVVAGKAGTGKSLIALHKLARVPQDKSACLVVFTKSLKRYFEDGIKALGIEDYKVQYSEEWDHRHVDYLGTHGRRGACDRSHECQPHDAVRHPHDAVGRMAVQPVRRPDEHAARSPSVVGRFWQNGTRWHRGRHSHPRRGGRPAKRPVRPMLLRARPG